MKWNMDMGAGISIPMGSVEVDKIQRINPRRIPNKDVVRFDVTMDKVTGVNGLKSSELSYDKE